MRTKHVLLSLGAAALSTCALAGPSLPVSMSADGNTVTVRGAATPLVHLTPAEAQATNGSFQLEDGRVLTLSSRNGKVYMELDGRRDELLPVSPTRFVARGSGTELAMDQPEFPMTVALTRMKP